MSPACRVVAAAFVRSAAMTLPLAGHWHTPMGPPWRVGIRKRRRLRRSPLRQIFSRVEAVARLTRLKAANGEGAGQVVEAAAQPLAACALARHANGPTHAPCSATARPHCHASERCVAPPVTTPSSGGANVQKAFASTGSSERKKVARNFRKSFFSERSRGQAAHFHPRPSTRRFSRRARGVGPPARFLASVAPPAPTAAARVWPVATRKLVSPPIRKKAAKFRVGGWQEALLLGRKLNSRNAFFSEGISP